jgi:hypothetical protein
MNNTSCLTKLDFISNYGPSFMLPASNFDVLYEPDEFYQNLKTSFAHARHRIYISSLYFGTDPYEYDLVGHRLIRLLTEIDRHVVMFVSCQIRLTQFEQHWKEILHFVSLSYSIICVDFVLIINKIRARQQACSFHLSSNIHLKSISIFFIRHCSSVFYVRSYRCVSMNHGAYNI